MSFISQPQDTSWLLSVLQQIDPSQADAVDLMNTVHENQVQLMSALTSQGNHTFRISQDISSLWNSLAVNEIADILNVIQQIKLLEALYL